MRIILTSKGDKNKARRDAVRRKTAQYLMKAEDLYNRHLNVPVTLCVFNDRQSSKP
jgi:hypothetical protein